MGVGAIHLRNKYYKKGVLGKGAFARVWKVQDKKTKRFFAAKSIAKVMRLLKNAPALGLSA